MLNAIWACMILGGIAYGAFCGTLKEVGVQALESAKAAVELCITMVGVMSLWLGMMQIARASGILQGMTKILTPVLHFLFPRIPQGHPAMEEISTNLISNILGLGWAATPAGLRAMKALEQLEAERGNKEYIAENDESRDIKDGIQKGIEEKRKSFVRHATDEMCTFLVINISSLQLVPINIIAYRSQYHSKNPAGILGPALLATLFSTLVAVLWCKIRSSRRRKNLA